MLGNIILGNSIYGDILSGIYVAEVQANISQSTVSTVVRIHGTLSSYHTKFRIPLLDIVVDLTDDDEKNVPKIGIGVYGNFDEFGTELLLQTGVGVYSKFINPKIVAKGYIPNYLGLYSEFDLEHPDNNAVAWSEVGALSFVQGQKNMAGKSPVDWKGYVYAIHQLGNTDNIYVYGDNGISIMKPNNEFYGINTVAKIGLKSKHAVVNTKPRSKHYYVDKMGILYVVDSQGIHKLGYEEFLSALGNISMFYDHYNYLVYICDGSKGYIYSEESEGLTEGPGNITSFNAQDGLNYCVRLGDITNPNFSVVTDIIDFGTLSYKTINSVSVECSNSNELEIAIDFRLDSSSNFTTTPFVKFNNEGVATIPCFGKDFRLRFRGPTDTSFVMKSVKIDGQIHDYNPMVVRR